MAPAAFAYRYTDMLSCVINCWWRHLRVTSAGRKADLFDICLLGFDLDVKVLGSLPLPAFVGVN